MGVQTPGSAPPVGLRDDDVWEDAVPSATRSDDGMINERAKSQIIIKSRLDLNDATMIVRNPDNVVLNQDNY
jgi:hypothetical protein